MKPNFLEQRLEQELKPKLNSSVFAFALSILLSIILMGCEKKSSDENKANIAIPATQPVEGDLVLTAKVLDISGTFPANDLYNYSYVMKYKVLQIIKGQYPDSTILIGHYNPKIPREEIKDEQDSKVGGNVKTFQVGDIHYLVLAPMEGTWNGAIEDDYFKEKRARYWALWADKL